MISPLASQRCPQPRHVRAILKLTGATAVAEGPRPQRLFVWSVFVDPRPLDAAQNLRCGDRASRKLRRDGPKKSCRIEQSLCGSNPHRRSADYSHWPPDRRRLRAAIRSPAKASAAAGERCGKAVQTRSNSLPVLGRTGTGTIRAPAIILYYEQRKFLELGCDHRSPQRPQAALQPRGILVSYVSLAVIFRNGQAIAILPQDWARRKRGESRGDSGLQVVGRRPGIGHQARPACGGAGASAGVRRDPRAGASLDRRHHAG